MNQLEAFSRTFRVFPYVLVYDMVNREPNKCVVYTLVGSYAVSTGIVYTTTDSWSAPFLVLLAMELLLRLGLACSAT